MPARFNLNAINPLAAIVVAFGVGIFAGHDPSGQDKADPKWAELSSSGLSYTGHPVEVERGLMVAFLGDHGTSDEAYRVLRMIKAEGVDLVLSQGDLGYDSSPDDFERMINQVLGPDFPFFASLGNHDRTEWARYWRLQHDRLSRRPDVVCTGLIGISASCTYKGLQFLTSAVGVFALDRPEYHAAFIHSELQRSAARWRVCSWHFPQSAMQVGVKKDAAGWGVYEACRKGGALIATAHDHSYARTYAISEFSNTPRVASYDADDIEIRPGETIAFVSGLGGQSIRKQRRHDEWWAATYSASQGARPGALFCEFHVDDDPSRARCYFKSISGDIPDRFDLTAKVSGRGKMHLAQFGETGGSGETRLGPRQRSQ